LLIGVAAGYRADLLGSLAALAPTADTDPYVAAQTSSAARADLLATVSTYSDDGVDLLSTLAPAHPAQLSSGDIASVRALTTNTYDTGAPTSDAYHLVTKTVVVPVAVDGTTVPDADSKTTVTGYDPIDGSSSTGATSGWTLRAATTETTWMGTTASSSNDLTTKTRYDSTGRVVETRLPGGTSTDANTTVTTYYTTAANSTYSACGGKPYSAGQVCRTDPGGSPSAGYAVPSKAYTYNLYGQPLTATETSGSVTRTTTTAYDAAGRATSSAVAVTGLSSSTAVPSATIAYDTSTGLAVTLTSGYAANDDGTCQSSTADSTVTTTYDTANRITTSGYSYDQLGRTLTVPASSLGSGNGALSLSYYDTDLTAAMTQGTDTKTFTLDPVGRYRNVVDSTSGSETRRIINHYKNDSDSPSWIATSTDGGSTYTWARSITGIDGNLAALQGSDGSSVLQIVNLHRDVVGAVPNHVPTSSDTSGASATSYFESTEYGTPRDATTDTRYGWLGGAQRSADALGSVILMGARLYNPGAGRFLSVDPVAGGNANPYDYCSGDSVNCTDLSGKYSCKHRTWWQDDSHKWAQVICTISDYDISSDWANILGFIGTVLGPCSAVARDRLSVGLSDTG
jgi:RHS repeat-associated protein